MWQHVTFCIHRRVISILFLLSKYVESSVIHFYRVPQFYNLIVIHVYKTYKILTCEGVFPFYCSNYFIVVISIIIFISLHIAFIVVKSLQNFLTVLNCIPEVCREG